MTPAPSRALLLAALSAASLFHPAAASAQANSLSVAAAATGPIGEYDVSQGEETHPPIALTPDNPAMVHLDSDARSVIVGNPAHLNAILDNARTMVLIARDPGATYLTVIGRDGKVIMQRHVIVAGPAEKYIRIRRNCAAAGASAGNCAQTTVYYCPDQCYETKILSSSMGQPGTPPASVASGSGDQSGDSSGSNPNYKSADPKTGQGEGPTPQSVYQDPATDMP